MRFRLHAGGVERRLLFRWDRWPWEDFGSGRIRYVAEAGTFVDPSRPWWRRKFSLAYLPHEAREAISSACMQHWQAPEVDQPDELSLRVWHGPFRLTRIRLDATGVSVRESGYTSVCPWAEVASAWLVRLNAEQPDFLSLCMVLRDRKLVLRKHIGKPRWFGADGATVLNLLQRYLPPERVHVACVHGEPPKDRDLVLRIQILRHILNGIWIMWLFLAVLVLMLVPAAYLLYVLLDVNDGYDLTAWAIMMVPCVILPTALAYIARANIRAFRDALRTSEERAVEVLGAVGLDAALDEAQFDTNGL